MTTLSGAAATQPTAPAGPAGRLADRDPGRDRAPRLGTPGPAGGRLARPQPDRAQLAAQQPGGFRYVAIRLDDGVGFVHVAVLEDDRNPLALDGGR